MPLESDNPRVLVGRILAQANCSSGNLTSISTALSFKAGGIVRVISPRLKSVILRELDLEDFEFARTTTADSVPGWDSLSHVRIILAIENEYGIRFSTLEVMKMKQVGDLQEVVDRKAR